MQSLDRVAPAFLEMAHGIAWATVATVDAHERPRSRVLHPYWQWDGDVLKGWIATGPTPIKRAHLEHSPYVSVAYWSPNHDHCIAECGAEWAFDDATREAVWQMFKEAPAPVGYDPAVIPAWAEGPRGDAFAVLKLAPWRLKVFPAGAFVGGGPEVLLWSL